MNKCYFEKNRREKGSLNIICILGIISLLSVIVVIPVSANCDVYFSLDPASIQEGQGHNVTVQVLIDSAPGGTVDNWGTWVKFDPTCVNITGYAYQSITGNTIWVHEGDRVKLWNFKLNCEQFQNGTALVNLTIQCVNSSYCESPLEFIDNGVPPDKFVTCIFDERTTTWHNGSVSQGTPSGPGIADHVVISEVYADAVNEMDSEWIELYNPTNSAINISGWTINTASYQLDATLPTGTEIPAHEFYLIGDAGWDPDNSSWPTTPDYSDEITLNNNNGWVQLNDSTGTMVDTLGWGSATTNETLAYPTNPPQNQSLQRKINDTIEQNGYGPAWDTNNNSADFFIQQEPDPQYSGSEPVAPIPELSTFVLLSMGLVALVALLKRWR